MQTEQTMPSMPSGSRLRLGLRPLRSRFRAPYCSRWLRRVGFSFRYIGRLSVHVRRVEPRPGRTRVRASHHRLFPHLFPRWLNKYKKQDRLPRLLGHGSRWGIARMDAEEIHRPRLGDEDLLEGWKAIADHLDKTERTVQRWEKSKALPVRRLRASSAEEQGRVFAFKSELDAWCQDLLTEPDSVVDLGVDQENPPEFPTLSPQHHPAPEPKLRRVFLWITAASGLTLLLLVAGWIPNPFSPRTKPAHGRVTLAVRPFKDLDADPSWEFVASGLTEEMVTRLGQLHPQQMLVVRLTPAYAAAPPERLAKDIRADYVLEGSVRKVDDRIAITAQLIQVSNQSVVWGQDYEREIKDLLRVQNEVANAITGEA